MTQILKSTSLQLFIALTLLLSGCNDYSSNRTVTVDDPDAITLEDPDTGALYKEGLHFYEVGEPAENSADLTIFFSFGCAYCREFHSPLETWLETQSERPTVQWIPVNLKKEYATGVELGKQDEIRASLFECIWAQADTCIFVASDFSPITDEEIAQWFSDNSGVDYTTSLEAWQSDKVSQLVANYSALKQQFNPQYVPQVIVSGHYQIIQSAFDNWDDYFNLVDLLIKRHQEPLPQ